MNVAAGLDEAAADGDILLGERTYRLVAQHVDAEPLEPVAIRGRRTQERPMRVISLHFLLLQDGEVVHAAGGADGGFWDGTAASAHNLKPGPVQAVGVAVLAAADSADACETYTWSERIELTWWVFS